MHDANAIRVFARGHDAQLGWVPRELAARIAPDLDAGTKARVLAAHPPAAGDARQCARA